MQQSSVLNETGSARAASMAMSSDEGRHSSPRNSFGGKVDGYEDGASDTADNKNQGMHVDTYNVIRKGRSLSSSSALNPNAPDWRKAVTEEAQRLARLNPDAPEFAPVQPKSMGMPNRERDDTQIDAGTGDPAGSDWDSWTSTLNKGSSSSRVMPSYTIPLKSPGPDEMSDNRRLRRTLSEGHLMSGIDDDPSQSSSVSPLMPIGGPPANRTPVPLGSYNAPNRVANAYVTPNTSPNRHTSFAQPLTGSSQGPGTENMHRDNLVVRTKALLEHQMRTNLAFAEAVAAEYGRELAGRIEAHKRAFNVERARNLQMMEMTIRRRVADAEDAIRRQYEERHSHTLRILELRQSSMGNGAGVMDPRFSGIDPRDIENLPPPVQRQLGQLVRESTILRTELEMQKQANQRMHQDMVREREQVRVTMSECGDTAEALARTLTEEREQRLMLAAKVNALEDRGEDVSVQSWSALEDNKLPADGAVQDAFLNGTPDELRELVLRLNNERDRLSKDNTLLTRKLAVFEDDTENSASDTGSRRHEVATLDKERGPAKEGDWMESLQKEVLSLEKNMMWAGHNAARGGEMREKIKLVLNELEKHVKKLQSLLGPEGKRLQGDGKDTKRREFAWDSAMFMDAQNPTSPSSMFQTGDNFDGFNTAASERAETRASSRGEETFGQQEAPAPWMGKSAQAQTSTFDSGPGGHSQDMVNRMYGSAFGINPRQYAMPGPSFHPQAPYLGGGSNIQQPGDQATTSPSTSFGPIIAPAHGDNGRRS